MFKFVHTADVHLDSPLKSLALRDPHVAKVVGGATHLVLERIVDLCIDEEVNALIVAGDLFDGDVRSMQTVAFLNSQMRRLEKHNIRVYMIRGNHDSESTIRTSFEHPKNVHVFSGRGGVEELRDNGVAIHGVSYSNKHAPESLLGKYRQPVPGLFNIGIMHTSLSGAIGHDPYAPCSERDLKTYGFNYWALGHIHQREVIACDPWIVMPGIPQGRDIQEEGPKSVTVVEVTDFETRIEERFLAVAEFQRVEVDFTGIDDWQGVLHQLEKELEKIRSRSKAEYVICRIILVGETSLGWRLRRDSDLFEEEAKARAEQLNKVMIDGIDYQLEFSSRCADGNDPVDELEGLMLNLVQDSAFNEQAQAFLANAVRKLPAKIRDQYGSDQDGRKNVLRKLLNEGIANVVASLKCGQETSLEETN